MRGSIAARPALLSARLDHLDEPAQVLPLDVAPHQPGQMVLAQQRLQVRCAQLDLAAVGLQQPRSTLALGSLARLLRRLRLFRLHCRQVLKETDRRLALVLGLTHVPRQASCMPIDEARRKTLTLSGQRMYAR